MRIYQPQNQYGQDLLSTADMVNSTKTITKAISNGKVEISKSDLGTDKASDWTVLEVVFGGNKIMAGVASTDDKITVTLDDAGSTFAGNVTVTLTYESAMNITEDAQQPPVVVQQGLYIEDGDLKGKCGANFSYSSIYAVGPDCDMSELVDGTTMFNGCINMTSFSGDLPALTNGERMFENCNSLTSFSGVLSALSNGDSMFRDCSNLASFSGDLSALTNGQSMFYYCWKLTSFTGDLSALTNGYYMFGECSSLTSFSGKLSSLTNGSNMFSNCKLDQASVDHILDTINDLKAKGTSGTIHLGVASGVNKRTSDFAAKGWRVS